MTTPLVNISAVPVAPVAAAGTTTLGISTSSVSDAVLVTTQNSGLSLRKLSEQHVVNSMSLPATRSFQCHAVQHSDTGCVYAAISAPNEIRQWNSMTESFSDGSSMSLLDPEDTSSHIHSLHTANSVDGVIAVFNDGRARRCTPESFSSQSTSTSTPHKRKEKRPKATPADDRKRKHAGTGATAGEGGAATTVLWAHVLTEQKSGDVRVVTVAVQHDTGACHITVRKVDAKRGEMIPQQTRALDVSSTATCVTCTFQWPDTLLSLWSDGSLRRTCVGKGAELLDLDVAGSDAPLAPLPTEILTIFTCFGGLQSNATATKRKTKPNDKALGRTCKVTIEAISPSLVLVAGAASSSSHHLTAVLWNTTFSTVHAHASFGDDVSEGAAWASSDVMRGVVHNGLGCAIVATSSRVVALNFPGAVDSCTLAGAMNSLTAAQALVSAEWLASKTQPVVAYTPAWSVEATRLTPATISSRNSAVTDALHVVLDLTKTSTAKTLLPALHRYFTAVDDSGRKSKKPRGNAAPADGALAAVPGDQGVGATQYDLVKIMQRCLEEKRYFPANAMISLLQQRTLSVAHCPTLLDVAVGSHNRKLIHACFSYCGFLAFLSFCFGGCVCSGVRFIIADECSEQKLESFDIVIVFGAMWRLLNGIDETTALSFFSILFRNFIDGLRKATKNSGVAPGATGDGSESELEEFLRLIFAHGWNDDALTVALGALSLEEILHLLDSLQWWLHLYANTADVRAVGDKYEGPVPTQAQILDWLAAVVDAKFATLIHSEETHDTIKRISVLLLNHTEECDSMKGVRGLIGHILEKKPIARPHAEIGPYSIEIVTL